MPAGEAEVEEVLASGDVLLFMKGSPDRSRRGGRGGSMFYTGEKPVVSKPVVSTNKPNFWQIS